MTLWCVPFDGDLQRLVPVPTCRVAPCTFIPLQACQLSRRHQEDSTSQESSNIVRNRHDTTRFTAGLPVIVRFPEVTRLPQRVWLLNTIQPVRKLITVCS